MSRKVVYIFLLFSRNVGGMAPLSKVLQRRFNPFRGKGVNIFFETYIKSIHHKQLIVMANHRWEENKCLYCGCKRTKKTFKYLMAITNHPPYDHYIYEQGYIYETGEQTTKERPSCSGRNRKNVMCNKIA